MGRPKKPPPAPNVFLNGSEVHRVKMIVSALDACGVRGWPVKLLAKLEAIKWT